MTALLLAGALVGASTALRAEAAAAPAITSVSPITGTNAGGTAITVTGTGFVAGASVTVGGNPATGVTVVSATQITATTPAGAPGSAVVVVTNADTQSGTLSNGFTYLVTPPSITSVAPSAGSSLGATAVTITGADFLAGLTVTFGGTAATGVTVVSATQITATAPAHTAGAVDVVVTSHDGQPDTLAGGYTYTAAAVPTVSAVAPASGTTGGGAAVTITGTGFASGASVTFGGTAATSVSVLSATQITATTPAHTAGAVSVVVTNADTQGGAFANGYTYVVSPAPAVTAVGPASGTLNGGTFVLITGTGFLPGATVTFGTTAATGVAVSGDTVITALAPAQAVGKVGVTVTNTDAQSGSLASAYEYLPAPAITSISPPSGAIGGGETVKIAGKGFASGVTVFFGGVAAPSATVVSSGQIDATAPAHAAGAVALLIVNPNGESVTKTAAYEYVPPVPVVTAAVPSSGAAVGGTTVTIAGSGFESGATVTFGDVPATAVTVVDATQITAVTPSHDAGAVSITVTNTSGKTGTAAGLYTFQGATAFVTGTVPASGLGLVVFGGGTSDDLVASAAVSGCAVTANLRFFATSDGGWLTFIPAAADIVNATWNAHFAAGVPALTALAVRCD